MHRRTLLIGALGLAAVAGLPRRARAGGAGDAGGRRIEGRIEVWKTPTCGCCGAWVDHLVAAGFVPEVASVMPAELVARKTRLGIRPEHASCHTALVGGYVVEGHVPAADIERLLDERPEAVGLAVPGMPVGSPGMEMGDRREPFETLLVTAPGVAEVYARHG